MGILHWKILEDRSVFVFLSLLTTSGGQQLIPLLLPSLPLIRLTSPYNLLFSSEKIELVKTVL